MKVYNSHEEYYKDNICDPESNPMISSVKIGDDEKSLIPLLQDINVYLLIKVLAFLCEVQAKQGYRLSDLAMVNIKEEMHIYMKWHPIYQDENDEVPK